MILALIAATAVVSIAPPRADADGFRLPADALQRLGSAKFRSGRWIAWAELPALKTVVAASGELFRYEIAAWDTGTGKPRWRWRDVDFYPHKLAAHADGNSVWIAATNRPPRQPFDQLRLIRVAVADGKVLSDEPVAERTPRVESVSADGRVVTQDTSHELFVWKPGDKAPRKIGPALAKNEYREQAVVDRAGTVAVTLVEVRPPQGVPAPSRYELRALNLKDGTQKLLAAMSEEHQRKLWVKQVSRDGRMAAVMAYPPLADRDRCALWCWDTATGKQTVNALLENREYIDGQHTFHPDGNTVFVSCRDRELCQVFDTRTGKELHPRRWTLFSDVNSNRDPFELAADGKSVTTYTNVRAAYRYPSMVPVVPQAVARLGWDTATGAVLPPNARTPGGRPVPIYNDRLVRVVSPDGTLAADVTPSAAKAIPATVAATVWRVGVPNGPRRLADIPLANLAEVAFTTDNRFLLAVGYQFPQRTGEGQLTAWPLTGDGKPFALPVPQRNGAWNNGRSVYPAPSGSRVALLRGNGQAQQEFWALDMFDLESRKPLAGFNRKWRSMAMGWSLNGRFVCVGGIGFDRTPGNYGRVFVGEPATERVVAEMVRPQGVRTLALSPCGRTVAVTNDWNGDIELLEVASGRPRCRFRGHRHGVTTLAFSPDGRQLAAESSDDALLWDVAGALLPGSAPDAARRDKLWADLAGDPAAAFTAVRILARDPEAALKLLDAKIDDRKRLPADRVAKLLAELGDRDFATREAASAELLANLDDVLPAARARLARPCAAEEQRRLNRLVAAAVEPTADRLRLTRAVEAVEWIGTPSARETLTRWGKSGSAVLGAEATAALARLEK